MLLHSLFTFIWHATRHYSEKVEFWPCSPFGLCVWWWWWWWWWGGGSAGKIYGSMLLNFVILFNLICKMTMFWKSLFYYLLTSTQGSWERGWVCGETPATMLLHLSFVIPFNWICNMTMTPPPPPPPPPPGNLINRYQSVGSGLIDFESHYSTYKTRKCCLSMVSSPKIPMKKRLWNVW